MTTKQCLAVIVGGAILSALACAALAQGKAPLPPLEQFPAAPYIAPETPPEKACRRSELASNLVARRVFDAAASNLLVTIGRTNPTNWQDRMQAAKALDATAATIRTLPKTTRDRFTTNQTEAIR
jgi:hypothetical protein